MLTNRLMLTVFSLTTNAVISYLKISSFLICFFFINQTIQSKTIYVKQSQKGNGKSWNQAFSNLQGALKIAKFGDEIWVAEGIYFPTIKNDRCAHFDIPDGVKLYGGFKGNETEFNSRKPKSNITTLSGDIGMPNIVEDNVYNVIYTKNVSNATVLDGFHVLGGNADQWKKPQGHPHRSGGGWYNQGANTQSNPVVRNCYFSANTAVDGGAIYNNGNSGRCIVQIKNCSFVQNIAYMDGGAIYNDCHNQGVVRAYFENCYFTFNESNCGAGIFNFNTNGRDDLHLVKCSFFENKAWAVGSAVYDHSFDSVPLRVENCQFHANYSGNSVEAIFVSKNRKINRSNKVRIYRS